jgi:Ca-activated chloride channel family protein
MIGRLALSLGILAAGTAVLAAQGPLFSSRVEAVRVDVLATENGAIVKGLAPGDFELLDNGVPQQVDLVSFEDLPLNVILALDMSASLAGERLDHLRSAGKALLNGLRATDQAALVTFSHVVVENAALTADFTRVRAALDAARASGETSLVDATYTGIVIGESDVGRSLLIVFSDGVDTTSWLSPESVLETARRSDVVVYGVEVGKRKASFPRDLSTATGGRLIEVESTEDLAATFGGILEEFRQRYVVSYSPRGVARGGWHRLDVRIKGRNVTVKSRPGYLSGP